MAMEVLSSTTTATTPLLSEHLQDDGLNSQENLRLRRASSTSTDNLLLAAEEASSSSSALSEPLLRISHELQSTSRQQRFLLSLVSYVVHDNRILIAVILAWYLLGVVAIVTTKQLLTDWQVPPLLLTFQQLLLASTLLRMRLAFSGEGAQPIPTWKQKLRQDVVDVVERVPLFKNEQASDEEDFVDHHDDDDDDSDNPAVLDFFLAGLFNAMDFLASNTAFSASAANFVETIKASDPITTTTVALMYKVDRLGGLEACSMVLLVSGILLISTWGTGDVHVVLDKADAAKASWESSSVHAALLVVVANFSFALRAMTQKLYQNHAKMPLNDENLLCRLQQVGWLSLFLPVMLLYASTMREALLVEDHKWDYCKLSMLNAFAYATYNLASTYVLTQLTVIQHSTLSCLRRLFVIIMTCLFFGVPLTKLGCIGMLMSFVGFSTFTHFRRKRRLNDAKSFNFE